MQSRGDEDTAGAVRSGPSPLSDDSWDALLPASDPDDDGDRYLGRRRRRDSPWLRSLAIVAILGLVAVAVAVLSRPSGTTPEHAVAGRSAAASEVGPMAEPVTAGTSQAAVTTAVTPAVNPPGTVPNGGTTTPGGDGRDQAVSRESPVKTEDAPAAPVFQPVIFEAEGAGVERSGSAKIQEYGGASGGSLVTGVGDWGEEGGPGTLRIVELDIPSAGTYKITLHMTTLGALGPYQAVVTVPGAGATTVQFAGPPTCCRERTVDVDLVAGTHSFTISNPNGIAPSIDKIVIRRA